DQMDLRVWDECDVLRAVSQHVDHVPRLLHTSSDPPFQIHEFVTDGRQLNEIAPRGTPVPPNVIPDVVDLFSQLATIRPDELPPLPAGWPEDGESSDFGRMLSGITQRVFDENQRDFGALFRAFGIPDDPLATVGAVWSTMASRPFRAVHADVHRQNMLMSQRGVVFLDWELALWGDPVYELAVHVHKMTYLDDELASLFSGWDSSVEPSAARSWRDDLTAYLRHERVKSAIVDSIRYTKEIVAEGTTEVRRKTLTDKLTGKLNAAGQIWGWRTSLSADEVDSIITGWAASDSRTHRGRRADYRYSGGRLGGDPRDDLGVGDPLDPNRETVGGRLASDGYRHRLAGDL
ncbi:MAG: phosphotransferase family protein, partial [Gammaproteobacteria bacterium]